MPHDPRLYDALGFQLSHAARIQTRRLEDDLRKLGLARSVLVILQAVEYGGRRQPSDIADHVGMDRTATSRTLRRMEADGLITRADGKTDGRTRTIALTPRGAELLSRAIPLAKRNAAVIAARLNPAEQAQLMSLLQKISTGDDTPPPNR